MLRSTRKRSSGDEYEEPSDREQEEEEEERSERWNKFLEQLAGSDGTPNNDSITEGNRVVGHEETSRMAGEDNVYDKLSQCDDTEEVGSEKEAIKDETRVDKVQSWSQIRPSLRAIEQMMSLRVNNKFLEGGEKGIGRSRSKLTPVEESMAVEESDDEFYDVERSEPIQEASCGDSGNVDLKKNMASQGVTEESSFPWKEELECLVRGGLPMTLRGELWQAFVGAGVRRVEGYYCSLLDQEAMTDITEADALPKNEAENRSRLSQETDKWTGQIEKDLPRTFPGHPALDENGRNALRRLLIAYARHNPSVGYCQAMNFFAGLLLLLMPEENAFWTLTGIVDDYFDGYYSEDMIECQVDQLVLEELARERFHKLVNHLDHLGVLVAWVTGPWFLSIFVNILPWESVLRVWDLILFDGNRVMLFRTTLALMELYGPAIMTTKDAGDAITLLQTLAGSSFDGSQLILTACVGYQVVNEMQLQELRTRHRPSVIASTVERLKGAHIWRDCKGDTNGYGDVAGSNLRNFDSVLSTVMVDTELNFLADLIEQATWLKAEVYKLQEEKRNAILRAEELETAFIEMLNQDNSLSLSLKVEQLEQEVTELRQAFALKQEQDRTMLEILMRVEQEHKLTEDARLYAEQEAAGQRHAVHLLQEKVEEAMILLEKMKNRAVMAETILEATLQYQSGQLKALSSPRAPSEDWSPRMSLDTPQTVPTKKINQLPG
ncbi:hypothetical protein ZIOFF_045356 [Zingiber officinale]|uniref:Rab-GAP TBC domain-containing protein n=1 Tax=Zingiber officinale TaxID=94328 RepID=A0A8J5L129_ZINOF|nr:hypothetical protein ZIOFF_045356 [Zingiber officinale]